MGDDQEAARCHYRPQYADDLVWVLVVFYEMQDSDQQERDRPGEVDQLPSLQLTDDSIGLPQVSINHGHARALLHQRPAVRHYDGVVIDISDPRVWPDGLRDLVSVAGGRQTAADVHELANALL